MPKFKLEIVERVVFDLEVEANDVLDALEKGREDFIKCGPILHVGGDFMSSRCVVREAHYHYEAEEDDGSDKLDE